jgi:hypothetical protein
VVIASTQRARRSIWGHGGRLSFSYGFWGHIFNGESIGSAFNAAANIIYRGSMRSHQRGLLDDNGNGVANEPADGALAQKRYIGSAFMTGGDAPVIGVVQDGAVCSGTNMAVWVSNVTDMDGVSNVWCTISAPWYDGTTEPPEAVLNWNSASNRYESTVDGLSWTGEYVVTYFAEDIMGEMAAPVQGSFSVVQPDSDGDGMPDVWEERFFAGVTNAEPAADSDADGFSNYQEWFAGTDPTNSASVFDIRLLSAGSTNGLVIEWDSAPNRSYSVWTATNLFSPFVLLIDDLLASPDGVNSFTDRKEHGRAFYKLKIEE